MCPVDTTGLRAYAEAGGFALPKPSIEHTIKPCDRCGRTCWIGPTQLFQKTVAGWQAVCYWCLLPMMAGGAYQVRQLDHTADLKPRRT